MNIINLRDVGEKFRIPFKYDRRIIWQEFWALRNVTFTVRKGECIGIIGENGSGKSTLLKIIAGILPPDEGEVEVNGTVSSLLEVGAGFNPELTGKENIHLQCSLFGLNRRKTEEIFRSIAHFSDLGDFLYAPLKSYSGGMYVRLAFSIAVHLDPDILLIDDILAVGDTYFQKKCIDRIEELKKSGKTLILVSHDLNLLNRLCDRGILLREGKLIHDGSLEELVPFYIQTVGERQGVIMVKKAPLTLIFNNGKFFLNWKEFSLFCHWGGHTCLLHRGNIYPSIDATWECQRRGETIHCKGEHLNLPVIEEWQLTFLTTHEVLWKVRWKLKETVELQKLQVSFIVPKSYNRWVTTKTQGGLPPRFLHDRNWESIHTAGEEEKFAGIVDGSFSLPATIFFKQNAGLFKIYNTGRDIEGRVIQVEEVPERCIPRNEYVFSGMIRVIDNDGELRSLLEREYTLYLERTSAIMGKDLALQFDSGRVRLTYKGCQLLTGCGVASEITFKDFQISSNTTLRKIGEKSNSRVSLILKEENIPVSQIWEFSISDKRSIRWRIYLEIVKPVTLKKFKVELLTPGDFNFWITPYQKGEFQTFRSGEEEIQPLLTNFSSSWVGLSRRDRSPAIILKALKNKEEGLFSSVYQRKHEDKIESVVRIHYLNTQPYRTIKPRRECIFDSQITLIEEEQKERLIKGTSKRYHQWQKHLSQISSIEKRKIRLVFENGKGRIFYKGKELTRSLDMYTSIHLMDFWVDSRHAIWKVRKLSENKLIVEGYWIHIPILQVWEIQIIEDNTIEWMIDQKILEHTSYDREQTSIMLDWRYTYWFVKNRTDGEFPAGFTISHPELWERMWSGNVKEGDIGAKSKTGEFPEITFEISNQSEEYKSIIVNSDELFSGRVLQIERINSGRKAHFSPSQYRYFKGRIILKDIK